MIWAFDINVRDVLQKWEERERRLGRPPWDDSKETSGTKKVEIPVEPIRGENP